MPSAKLSALVSLAGGQAPNDLVYIVDVSAGAAGSKKSTLDDFLSTITKNITDLSVQFQDGAGTATVSAANQGKIRYNDTTKTFQVSANGGAYASLSISSPPFADNSALIKNNTDNTKLLIISAASISPATTRTLTAQDANYTIAGTTVPLGGTGVSTLTSNGVLFGNGAGAIQATAQGAANSILSANAGAPSFSQTPTINTSVQVGVAASQTGTLILANAGGATLTRLQAGNAASSLTFVLPVVDPTAGQVLSASAPAAGVVTLSWVTGGGGGGTPGGLNTQVQYNNSGAFGGISGFTSDGTSVTAGSGNLIATSPKLITSILDTNSNTLIALSAAATAVNNFTIANAATGNSPTLSTSGADADINLTITPKGAGVVVSTGPLRLTGTGSDTFTTPAASGVPTKINIPIYDPGAFGQIVAMGIGDIGTNRRVLSLFDARTTAHQPTIAVFAPNENNLGGFSWDGSNSDFAIKTTFTNGVIRMIGGTDTPQVVIAPASSSPAAFLYVVSTINSAVAFQADGTATPTADVARFTKAGTTTAGSYTGVSSGLFLFDVGSKRVTTQFDKTNDTTLADITGLSVNVVAGKSYRFEAILYTTSNVATGVKFAIAGTATATAVIYEAIVDNAAAISAQTRATALGTAVGGVTAVTAAYCRITGTITVNAAGTLTVQFAENAGVAATTSSVLVGSTFTVNEIV